jgi:hypothetical protein
MSPSCTMCFPFVHLSLTGGNGLEPRIIAQKMTLDKSNCLPSWVSTMRQMYLHVLIKEYYDNLQKEGITSSSYHRYLYFRPFRVIFLRPSTIFPCTTGCDNTTGVPKKIVYNKKKLAPFFRRHGRFRND